MESDLEKIIEMLKKDCISFGASRTELKTSNEEWEITIAVKHNKNK